MTDRLPRSELHELCHVGRNADTQEHVFIAEGVVEGHGAVQGGTGSMKSTIVSYILCQLIKFWLAAIIDITDLGNTPEMFHRARLVCEQTGRPFRWISSPWNHDWDYFYPWQSVTPLTHATLPRAVDLTMRAASLDHGEGFGKKYFGGVNRELVEQTFQQSLDHGILCPSPEDLERFCVIAAKQWRKGDVPEPLTFFRQLKHCPQLYPTESGRRIDIASDYDQAPLYYGMLGSMLESTSLAIAALKVWNAVQTQVDRQERGLPLRHIVLIVDEFPLVAHARSWQLLLTLALKYKIHLILIFQSAEQLRGDARGIDLRPILRDNTRWRIYLTAAGDDIQPLRETSPEVPRPMPDGFNFRGLADCSVTRQQIWDFDLDINEIHDMSETQGDFIFKQNTGRGYTPPVRCRFDPIHFAELFTLDAHNAFRQKPLPERTTPLPPLPHHNGNRRHNGKPDNSKKAAGEKTQGRRETPQQTDKTPPPETAESMRRRTGMEELLAKLKAEENWL